MAEIPLADAVEHLRAELARAMAASADADIRFPVGEVQIQFHVGITREAGAQGGVRFWVVELGAQGAFRQEEIQTVTVTLQPPVDRHGRPVKVTEQYAEKP